VEVHVAYHVSHKFDLMEFSLKSTPERKLFRIFIKQKMMGWQWHQSDHLQVICTLLQHLVTRF